MQAEEARVAVRHAEIATKVALEAQAAAESALAGLHAAAQPSRGPAVVQPIASAAPLASAPESGQSRAQSGAQFAASAALEQRENESAAVRSEAGPAAGVHSDAGWERQAFGIRFDPDLPVRPVERKPAPTRRAQEEFELATEDWWSPAEITDNLRQNPIEVVEGGPVQANLIQFPRELVATRKIRPRLAEGYSGPVTDAEAQLSIFEVNQASVSTGVAASPAAQDAAANWNRTEWSGMRLDTRPAELAPSGHPADQPAASFPVAPMGLRLMAAVVDCALILASFVVTGFLVAHQFQQPPAAKTAELMGGGLLILIGLAYYALFFAFPVSTPGMKYAGIGLCTFDEKSPTRAQLRRRLGAMALSLLPVGLGVAWSIFDEDHMSWHDRFSQTYLRKL
jgi:uncharacterized RDD family membrane protein YckC